MQKEELNQQRQDDVRSIQQGTDQPIQQNNVVQNDMLPSDLYQNAVAQDNLVQARRILSWSGMSLFLMAAAVLFSQTVLGAISGAINPKIVEASWFTWAIIFISVVGIGLPVFYLAIRNIPAEQPGEVKKLGILKFLGIFFIAAAGMYLSNFFAVLINLLIAAAKGEEVMNPLAEVIGGSSIIYTFIYTGFVAPIVEEVIFRKILLNRLRRFGDLPAILLSAFAFGLFHMKLSQFIYATVLGIIFAYVTLKTNTIRYAIFLHIMINLIGGTVSTLVVQQENLIYMGILGLWVIVSIVIGIVVFILQVKKIHLDRAAVPLANKSLYILNPGTMLYILLCVVFIITLFII